MCAMKTQRQRAEYALWLTSNLFHSGAQLQQTLLFLYNLLSQGLTTALLLRELLLQSLRQHTQYYGCKLNMLPI